MSATSTAVLPATNAGLSVTNPLSSPDTRYRTLQLVLFSAGAVLMPLGALVVCIGWYGAAHTTYAYDQFPYLLSGGVAGLCFVVLGVGMLVVQNQRADRAALQATLRELQEALERAGLAQGTGDQRKPFAKPGPRPVAVAAVAAPVEEPSVDLTQETELPDQEVRPVAPIPAKPRASRAKPRKS
jgi:hypothetical protein